MNPCVSLTTVADMQDYVRSHDRVRVVGQQTKRPIDEHLDGANDSRLSLSQWQAIVEYDSSEFTITAKAGTLLADIHRVLSEQGQYMPFDPPLVDEGATLGGTIAAGIAGPCRLRYGGIRDFVLGARLIDGTGQVATVGGKVVKNAAGFDIPKLLVGSWGQLGVMLEVTLKVFPKPEVFRSIVIPNQRIDEAVRLVEKLTRCPIELDGLDIAEDLSVIVRVGGTPSAAKAAAERIVQIANHPATIIESGEAESELWRPLQRWMWHRPGDVFLRSPIVSRQIVDIAKLVERLQGICRFSAAGNIAWLSLPHCVDWHDFDRAVKVFNIPVRTLRASQSTLYRNFGRSVNHPFSERVALAFDPRRKFSMPLTSQHHA